MVSTTTAAFERARMSASSRIVSGVISGQSPDSTSSEPSKPSSASLQVSTASAVPRCAFCTTTSVSDTKGSTISRACPTTDTMRSAPASRAASTTQRTSGLPRISCATLGFFDFIRVPAPAASTMAAVFIETTFRLVEKCQGKYSATRNRRVPAGCRHLPNAPNRVLGQRKVPPKPKRPEGTRRGGASASP